MPIEAQSARKVRFSGPVTPVRKAVTGSLKRTLLLTSLLAIVAGCSREDQQAIRVQRVPKQPMGDTSAMAPPTTSQSPAIMADAQALPDAPPSAASEVQWTNPDGWKQLPGSGMRVASFQVSPQNPDVQLTVIPLAPQSLLANVNRWEGQIGLQPSKEADLGKVVTRLDANGVPADIVDLTGPASANPRQRLLGAIISQGDRMWFFKLQGPLEVVSAQKDNFQTFIKSVKFGSGGPAQPQAPGGAGTQMPAGHPDIGGAAAQQQQLPAGHPQLPAGGMGNMPGMGAGDAAQGAQISYAAPDGWTKEPAMALRVVSFRGGQGDKQVSVIVSSLPSVGSGSRLDNVNRWRGQVGLPPIKEGEPQVSQPVTVGGAQGALFDLVGPGDRSRAQHLLVAWVPKDNNWWFFKLSGPDDVVSKEQPNFEKFLKSVQFVPEKP